MENPDDLQRVEEYSVDTVPSSEAQKERIERIAWMSAGVLAVILSLIAQILHTRKAEPSKIPTTTTTLETKRLDKR